MGKEKTSELLVSNENTIEIKHANKQELEKIIEEYKKDPDNFYEVNKFELWDGNKNPALIISVELMCKFISDIWEEKNLGNPGKIIIEARQAAMFTMKYLGADIEGWSKVSPETAGEIIQKMGETDFKEHCKLILEDIKNNDPEFSKFLTEISVRDIKTGELRNENDAVAIVEMVSFIVRMMYEQMKKDGSKRN